MWTIYGKELAEIEQTMYDIPKLFSALLKLRSNKVVCKFLKGPMVNESVTRLLDIAETFEETYGDVPRNEIDRQINAAGWHIDMKVICRIDTNLIVLEWLGQWREHRKWKRIIVKNKIEWLFGRKTSAVKSNPL